MSDHELEVEIFERFALHRIPLSIAVIPFRLDDDGTRVSLSSDNCAHLIAADRSGAVEIALHGHSHVNRSTARNKPSEFLGLPPGEQAALIREAKAQLEAAFGHAIDGFVPPWNSFDRNTAEVATQLGFKYLSAGWDRPESVPGGLEIIPRTCSLRNIDRALGDAERLAGLDPCLVVVLHPDDFVEFRTPTGPGERSGFTTLGDLNDKLERLARSLDWIDPVFLRQIGTRCAGGAYWSRADKSWLDLVPYRLRSRVPDSLLFKTGRAKTLYRSLVQK